MTNSKFWGRIVAVVAVLCLVGGGAAFAQLQTGNLYGTVVDEQGSALPGVTVTLSGNGAPQVQVTDAKGVFRFLNLSPASYQLKAELEGFSTIEYPNVAINVGRNTQIEVTLSAAVEDVITVLGETPLLDERRISTGATVSNTELEKIPNARDPWAVLQTTPGVLTDRINVGGNESGQQSAYVGPGSSGDQAIWAVDGVVITDMAALGSSPAYYDFDAFEEMQVTTGGSDSTIATGGVVLNMVTKRGTNEWRGTGRYIKADKAWQAKTNVDSGSLGKAGPWNVNANAPAGANQAAIKQGNQIDSVQEYGAELGGPIVKDRLWVWGSYGDQKIDLRTIANVQDLTKLQTENLKFNAQIAANNSATLFGLQSEKKKNGRNAGPFRPQPTTWDQSNFGDKPTAAKIEDTHIFNSNFYLTGLYSIVNGGFQLAPEGGLDTTSFLDINGVNHNTFYLYQTKRPQDQFKLDASSFFNTGNLSHELKFGAGYRKADVESLTRWGGAGHYIDKAYLGSTFPYSYLYVARQANPSATNKYTSAYAQDTMSVGNLTANVGLRYDRQTGHNDPTTLPANPIFPDIMPSASYGGGDSGFTWTSVTPRLGLTYALGPERKTLLRASYSRFADQLGIGPTFQLNPVTGLSYAYFYANVNGPGNIGRGNVIDLNGNGVIDVGDVAGAGFSGNVNPFTRGILQSNSVDPNLDPPKTDELLLSVEHALLPEFVVGLNLTYRKISDILQTDLNVFDGDAYSLANMNTVGRRATQADYVLVTRPNPAVPRLLPNGQPYTLQYYQLKPGVTSRGGTFLFNGDEKQIYKGASLTFNKRLANRWMLRGNVTYADWTWDIPSNALSDRTHFLGGGYQDGDIVMQGSGTGSGAKGGVYINSKWSYSVNGLYQIAPDRPWGFNAALNLTGRQGYPIPYYERLSNAQRAGIPGFTRVQVVTASDEFRLDDIRIFDARLEKEFTFSDFGLTLGVDCFNVFNEGFIQQRSHRLRIGPSSTNPLAPSSDFVTEVTSPRIFRLGARLSFR
jgi:hypothetical protein